MPLSSCFGILFLFTKLAHRYKTRSEPHGTAEANPFRRLRHTAPPHRGGILAGSASASLEEQSDLRNGTAWCSTRIFERYSYTGGNRVSMSVTLFQGESGVIRPFAATRGGNKALFFKLNTVGEDAFLDTLAELL